MYKGNNKTALASQKRIVDAFNKLTKEMPYASVNISAICKEADVSRQTFYSLFESKENIVVYQLQTRYSFIPGSTFEAKRMSLSDLSLEYSIYITERQDVIEFLIKNDLLHLLLNVTYDYLMHHEQFLPDFQGTRRKYFARFLAAGLSSIARIYVESGEDNPHRLQEVIINLLGGKLFD